MINPFQDCTMHEAITDALLTAAVMPLDQREAFWLDFIGAIAIHGVMLEGRTLRIAGEPYLREVAA